MTRIRIDENNTNTSKDAKPRKIFPCGYPHFDMPPPDGGSNESPDDPDKEKAARYEKLLEEIADDVGFPDKFKDTGVAKLRAIATIIASLEDPNWRTPYPIQKFGAHLYFDPDEPAILSPISIDKAGPYGVDTANCIDGMERNGLLTSEFSELAEGAVKSYSIAPEWESVVLPVQDWQDAAENFFKNMNLRRPFTPGNPEKPQIVTTQYDKSKFYARILNPDTFIGCDQETIRKIQNGEHEFKVQPQIRDYLTGDPPWSLKQRFEKPFWPAVNLAYRLLSERKHFKKGEDADRTYNIRDCKWQAEKEPEQVKGDAGLYCGWLDAWLERKIDPPQNHYIMKEGLTADEYMHIEYEGPISTIPEFDIYNYNVGAIGILEVDDKVHLKTIALFGFERLPAEVLEKQNEDKKWRSKELTLKKLEALENIVEDERELAIEILDELRDHKEVGDSEKDILDDWKDRAKKGKETVEGVHALALIVELVEEHPEFGPLVAEILANWPF